MASDHKRLSRTCIYESEWVRLYRDRVELPSGTVVEQQHLVRIPRDGVAALMENDSGELLLIRTRRYTTGTAEWEIPAGGREEGESVEETARREALEESGWESRDHRHLYTYYPLIGISDHRFHIVHCLADREAGRFDRDEAEAVRWFSRSELEALINLGELREGFTLTAVLLWLRGRQETVESSEGRK